LGSGAVAGVGTWCASPGTLGLKKVALGLVTPFPVLAGESVDDAAIFFLETTLQLYKNSRGGKQISMGGCV